MALLIDGARRGGKSYIAEAFAKAEYRSHIRMYPMDYFRQYMIVGGMPQAVETYMCTRDFDKVDRVKRDILDLYRMTLKCYMANTGLLISHAFDEHGIVSEEIYKKLLFEKLEVSQIPRSKLTGHQNSNAASCGVFDPVGRKPHQRVRFWLQRFRY